MAKYFFVRWLVDWLDQAWPFEFDWDDGNRLKSARKHGVLTSEIEEVFLLRRAVALGIQIEPAVDEERFGIVGATAGGRVLQVVFTRRGQKIRPISARPANRPERRLYEAVRSAIG